MTHFTFFVRHDLVELNNKEASHFYIVAQDIDTGRRLALTTSDLFSTEIHEQKEIKAKQHRRIIAIEKHCQAGGSLNPEHWKEIDPAYGSVAWQLADRMGMLD